ncbi:MAG: alpha-N-arabinofuranosidase, partial [Prevotella sp.]|nr:alpha-N-arabinofuranosidase [Prevotella sp.]
MYDCYVNHHYQFRTSEDLKTFKFVQNTETKGKFTPRHGTIIPITKAEKERLLKAFGNGE